VEDRLGHDYRYALDVSSAASIGFAPQVPFAQGLDETIDWYLANREWVATMRAWQGM
jgi:dTDP-glucose 4,6-dehydratase